MNAIFWGFVFLFIDLNFNFNGSVISFTPTFVGFILILRGLRELDEDSQWFDRARPIAIGMAVYTGILWVLDLVGFRSWGEGVVMLVLGLAATIFSLMVSWRIVQGLKDVESKWAIDLQTDKLNTAWKFLAVIQITVYPLALVPYLNIAAVLMGVIASIVFLFRFHRSRTLYNQPKPLI